MKWSYVFAMLLPGALLLSAQGASLQGDAGLVDVTQQGQAKSSAADVLAAAVADYRAGKFGAALASLQAELAVRGDEAAPEVRLNASLCALRLLHSRDAEELIAPLADDEQWGPEAAFVLGLASSQHAERALVAAKLVDAEPMAWGMASRAVQGAELQFRRAVSLKPDWPEAVRNLERTIRRRAEIEADRAAATAPDAKKEDAPKPEPDQPPKNQDQAPEVVIPEIAVAELTAKELTELQQRVRDQQRQKVTGRQQRSRTGSTSGDRDW
ncbi:MAG: hypothetical protein ACI8UD_001216 [Planctomycetota bacterium]|jgi:hypothetical protein